MPWIRLDDDYMNDEKIQALTDGAFRLWHEGLAYCRKQLTDGLIPFVVMRNFKYYTKGREKQLAAQIRDMAPLWMLIPATGYKMNQYLKWNPSRDVELAKRESARERMQRFRSDSLRRNERVTNDVTDSVTNALVLDGSCTTPDLVLLERESEGKPLAESEQRERFDRFWAAYPRKVGKDPAWKAWQKKQPTEELLGVMLAALAWQRQTPGWLKDGGDFIPHPATWLNQGRWKDEPRHLPRVGKQTSQLMAALSELDQEAS